MDKRISVIFAFLALLTSGCAATPVIRVDQGPVQTHLQSLEAKIQEDSRQLEQKLAREGAIYDDPKATAYLQDLGERLVPPEATLGGFTYQFHIVRDPTVNAYSLPDGHSYCHVGLLARMRNPDMLAAVLAHELSHAIHRDSLYMLDSFHQKTVAAKIVELTLLPAAAVFGAGGLASLTLNAVYAASVTGYGREKEAQADTFGSERLQAVSMNPAAMTQVFELLLKDEKRYKQGFEIWFIMDHPATRQRLADAKTWLANQDLGDLKLPADDPQFLLLTDPIRLETASLDIRFERYFHALEILEDVLSRQPTNAAALTLQGECCRRLAEDSKPAELELSSDAWKEIRPKKKDDWKPQYQGKAQEAFSKALQDNPTWADAYRGLGLLLASQGRREEAVKYLQDYLRLNPEAKDKRFITAQLKQLEQSEAADAKR